MALNNGSKPRVLSLILHLLYLAVLVGLLLFAVHYFEHELPIVEKWIAGLGMFAPLAFIALFGFLTPMLFPVDVLCFAAGVLFSMPGAFLYIAIASFLAAGIMFLIGRNLLSGKLRVFFLTSPRFSILDRVITENAFKVLFLLRLTPLPFALLSYALGLTRVGFWPYLIATAGILVNESVIIYFGYSTKHISVLLHSTHHAERLTSAFVLGGLLVAVVIWGYVISVARKALLLQVSATAPEQKAAEIAGILHADEKR
ncbi:MAG: TVP38/TMEM64 family protein [Gammaproteobacteria bacterium]